MYSSCQLMEEKWESFIRLQTYVSNVLESSNYTYSGAKKQTLYLSSKFICNKETAIFPFGVSVSSDMQRLLNLMGSRLALHRLFCPAFLENHGLGWRCV